MEWIKVFDTQAEAEQHIQEHRPQLVIIGDVRICLIRHRNQFSAIQDACPHKGESLSKGHVNYMGEIVCPFHNYCYETRFGREVQGRSMPARTYPVRIDTEGFFIGL